MGRVRGEIEVNGRRLWTLFDTVALNTHVAADCVGGLAVSKLGEPQPSSLGGRTHVITQECLFIGRIEGHQVSTNARVVGEIGADEDGKRIEVLFGALAMQNYSIKVDPKNEKLDFTHYPKAFVEF